jgi:LEA14-like dessication related protein
MPSGSLLDHRGRARARLAALAAASLAGCATGTSGAAGTFSLLPPRLDVVTFGLEDVDAAGATLLVRARATNANAVDVALTRHSFAIEIDGRRVSTGEVPAPITLPAGRELGLRVPLRLRWSDIPGFATLLVTRRTLGVRVQGAAISTLSGVAVELPWSADGIVALPRPPTLTLTGASVLETSVLSSVVEVKGRIRNSNPFPLPQGRFSYAVSVGEVLLEQGDGLPVDPVPAATEIDSTLRVKVSHLSALRAFLEGSGSGDARVVARLSFGALETGVDAFVPVGGSR